MKIFALFGRPEFLRGFHGWATVIWFALSLPMAYLWGSSVIFVTFLSLYAIVTGHWSSWQASRVEVLQSQQMKEQGMFDEGEDSNGETPAKHWIYEGGDYEKIYRHERERVIYGFSTYDWFNFSDFLSDVLVGGLKKFKEEGSGYPGNLKSKAEWDAILDEMIEGFEIHRADNLEGMVEDESATFGWRQDEELHKANMAKFNKSLDLLKEYYTTLWD